MINLIVVNTNTYIAKMCRNEIRTYKTKETTAMEIKGVIDLSGVLHGGRMNVNEYWTSDGTSLKIFPVTMG